MARAVVRCPWPKDDPLMVAYHDTEWGVPVRDDRKHFEFLVLDGFQAGLSWATVLHKREGFRRAFAGFDPAKVARFTPARVAKLLLDPGIVRNRQKVLAAVMNARAFQRVQDECGSFDRYIWRFVGGRMKVNCRQMLVELPATSPESDAMAKDLRARGFSFCGSTICYAYMQAAGMVNDHLMECFRYAPLAALGKRMKGAGG
ncbi:MAG: DNA-3-methyladenine glycosylase I [bacterium]